MSGPPQTPGDGAPDGSGPDDAGGVELLPLHQGVRVRIIPQPSPPDADPASAVGREWQRRCGENADLRNEAVLSVVSLDAEAGEIVARRDNYQRLVVQPRVATGVRLLAVTGVLVTRLADGNSALLLGRRAHATRMYGGMWELGPAGGVHVPPLSVTELSERALADALADEVEEEIGLRISGGRAVAVVRNHPARSDDVVMRVEVETVNGRPPEVKPANWEYLETAWVGMPEIKAFEREHAGKIIPAARAIFAFLGAGGT